MRNLDFEIAWYEQINFQLDHLISRRDYLAVRLHVVCIGDVLSGLVPDLKRLWAPRMLVKNREISNKERAQEIQRSALNGGTHTTLPCCVARHVRNPQKTRVLGARPVSRTGVQALSCVPNAYGCNLLSSYINGLNSRPSLPPSNAWEA